MERIGIYGGTFNPPHIGHIRGAAQAIEALGLDKLLLIPDRIAPHKQLPPNSPTPQQRLEMLRLAARDLVRTEVSRLELNREGPSYTWQTVRQLRGVYPEAKLILIMGTDMFLSFLNWRKAEEILKEVSLAVLYRGEKDELEAIREQTRLLTEMGTEVLPVENTVTAISSTELRRLLTFDCAESFLDPQVYTYIRENGLYGSGANLKGLSLEQLEQTVVSLLKPNRVAHVLGCRDAAVELARRWGADETDAARAGLLHDITKALTASQQLTLCDAYGKILDNFSRNYPKTLHALTGSLVAERIFGENSAVVRAICYHTTGTAGMNLLEKIIYVADYMEPNRSFPGVEKLRELAFSNMDAALKLGLEMTLDHLKNQGSEVSPATRQTLAWLEGRSV